jgi:PIN domain nuclease of toxin-antitoxin system
MRLLLDTHALLWWWLDDPHLTQRVRSAIGGEDADVHVSAATAIEIATKFRVGKLPTAARLVERFEAEVAEQGFRQLSISVTHAKRAGLLVGDHRDPFDRILAAQSIIEGLTVVTTNARIEALGASTLW